MEHGTFLGWIGDDVLHSLYRIADLTVVPSIYEPFGLVALEAMASGCPCIVADTGGLREVVPHEEAGLRFRAHDPEALAEVAIRVLSDDELGRSLVAEAYEHLRRFDWGDVAEQTAAVYADLAGAKLEPGAERELALPERRASRREPRSCRSVGACPASSRCPRSARWAETESAPASLISVSMRGSRRPRSSRPISVRCSEARMASSSCERSARLRQRRGSPRSGRRCPPAASVVCLSRQTSTAAAV